MYSNKINYAKRLNYRIIFNALFQFKSTTDFCEWTASYHFKNISYITVKVQKTWMATRFSAFLDYGQGTSDNQQEMTDAVKKALFFKSKVEIYNFLDRNG